MAVSAENLDRLLANAEWTEERGIEKHIIYRVKFNDHSGEYRFDFPDHNPNSVNISNFHTNECDNAALELIYYLRAKPDPHTYVKNIIRNQRPKAEKMPDFMKSYVVTTGDGADGYRTERDIISEIRRIEPIYQTVPETKLQEVLTKNRDIVELFCKDDEQGFNKSQALNWLKPLLFMKEQSTSAGTLVPVQSRTISEQEKKQLNERAEQAACKSAYQRLCYCDKYHHQMEGIEEQEVVAYLKGKTEFINQLQSAAGVNYSENQIKDMIETLKKSKARTELPSPGRRPAAETDPIKQVIAKIRHFGGEYARMSGEILTEILTAESELLDCFSAPKKDAVIIRTAKVQLYYKYKQFENSSQKRIPPPRVPRKITVEDDRVPLVLPASVVVPSVYALSEASREDTEKAHDMLINGEIAGDDMAALISEGFYSAETVRQLLHLERDAKGSLTEESKKIITDYKNRAAHIIREKGECMDDVKKQLYEGALNHPDWRTGKKDFVCSAVDVFANRTILWRFKKAQTSDERDYYVKNVRAEAEKIENEHKVYFTDQMRRNALLSEQEAAKLLHDENNGIRKRISEQMLKFKTGGGQVINLHERLSYLGITFDDLLYNVNPKCFIVTIPLNFCQQIYAFILLREYSVALQKNHYKGVLALEGCDCYSMLNNHLVLEKDFKLLQNADLRYCGDFNAAITHYPCILRILQHRWQDQRLALGQENNERMAKELRNYKGVNLTDELKNCFRVEPDHFFNRIDPTLLKPGNNDIFYHRLYHFFWLNQLMRENQALELNRNDSPSGLFNYDNLIDSINAGIITQQNADVITAFQKQIANRYDIGTVNRMVSHCRDKSSDCRFMSESEYRIIDALVKLIHDVRNVNAYTSAMLPTHGFAFCSWYGNCNLNSAAQILLRTTPLWVLNKVINDFVKDHPQCGRPSECPEIVTAQYHLLTKFRGLLMSADDILYHSAPPRILSAEMYDVMEALRWLAHLKFEPLKPLFKALRITGMDYVEQEDVVIILEAVSEALGIRDRSDIGYLDVVIETASHDGEPLRRVVKNPEQKKTYVRNFFAEAKKDATLESLLNFAVDAERQGAANLKEWGIGLDKTEKVELNTHSSNAVILCNIDNITHAGLKFAFTAQTLENKACIRQAFLRELRKGTGSEIEINVPVATPFYDKNPNKPDPNFYELNRVRAKADMILLHRGEGTGHYFWVSISPHGNITIQDDNRDLPLRRYKQVDSRDELKQCNSLADIIKLGYTPVLMSTSLVPGSCEYAGCI